MNIFKSNSNTKGQRNEDLPEENDGFPDSERPHGLCPRCNKQSSFGFIGELPATYSSIVRHTPAGRDYFDRVVALECRNCIQPILVIEECLINGKPISQGISSGTIRWKGFFWWPFSTISKKSEIPDHIQSALTEAKITNATNCYRASAVMSRRVLEAITTDKGETTGTLANRISNLIKSGVLDKNLGEWATEIRLIGNQGAHFDPITTVEKEDASQIILFIEELLKYLYVMPAEIQKRRKIK